MPQDQTDEPISICSCNVLVPSGSKPLPEPIMAQFHDAHNKLILVYNTKHHQGIGMLNKENIS